MSLFQFRPLARFVSSVLLLTVVGAFPVPMVEAEEFPSATFGGKGGTSSYNLDCGSNGIMVGGMYRGHTGGLDQLVVICRTVDTVTGALGDEYTGGPVGGFGGRDFFGRCRAGTVVTRVIKAYHGQVVDGIVLGCDRWNPPTRQIQQEPEADNSFQLGIICFLTLPGCNISQEFICPGERVAKALRGRFGFNIDSTQLICDDWNQ